MPMNRPLPNLTIFPPSPALFAWEEEKSGEVGKIAYAELPTLRLAADLLSRGLSEKGRTCESSRRSSSVDSIDQCFVERNIDTYGSAGIGQQWNGKQDSACFDRSTDI